MTGEEEAVLKEFLMHYGEIEDGEGFEAWYLQCYEGGESEDHYKQTLNVAPGVEAPIRRELSEGVSNQPGGSATLQP